MYYNKLESILLRYVRDMQNDIGNKIKDIRNRHNLSQERFGSKVGLSGKTISSYETGRSTPPLKVLEDISDKYSVPLLVNATNKNFEYRDKILRIRTMLSELESVFD
jgi:transcriptional regulator with XRE-family HTH domain